MPVLGTDLNMQGGKITNYLCLENDDLGGVDIWVVNNTGQTVVPGNVVVWDDAGGTQKRVKKGTLLADARRIAGVVVEGGEQGAFIKIRILGVAITKVVGPVVPGDILRYDYSNPAELRACVDNSPSYCGMGRAIDAAPSGNRFIRVLVCPAT